MDRKIIWTEKSSSDIEAIVRYIARRDPKAAARIGFGIYDRTQILLQHPEAGTVLPAEPPARKNFRSSQAEAWYADSRCHAETLMKAGLPRRNQ
jgi:plasmid stabilization system protein ParE